MLFFLRMSLSLICSRFSPLLDLFSSWKRLTYKTSSTRKYSTSFCKSLLSLLCSFSFSPHCFEDWFVQPVLWMPKSGPLIASSLLVYKTTFPFLPRIQLRMHEIHKNNGPNVCAVSVLEAENQAIFSAYLEIGVYCACVIGTYLSLSRRACICQVSCCCSTAWYTLISKNIITTT